MGRNQTQTQIDSKHLGALNERLALQALQEVVDQGVLEYCVCPGSRNHPLFVALQREQKLKKYFWFEERSAAFFALGRSRLTRKPVAVVTTSGTAVGELLAAVMEAYYTGVPLLLITADRPRRYRHTGAPQTAEHVGIFGIYAHYMQDVAEEEYCHLSPWEQKGPAHLNLCFDEPLNLSFKEMPNLDFSTTEKKERFSPALCLEKEKAQLDHFFHQVKHPFAVVSTLKEECREAVAQFLMKASIPVCLEGISGLREDPRLQHLRITTTEKTWDKAVKIGYEIDGVLRIGGVPTFRLWRDLENKPDLPVCSINDVPFSGLSGRATICAPLDVFFSSYIVPKQFSSSSRSWIESDHQFRKKIIDLFYEEPMAEPSLIYFLSKLIPKDACVYLGNSLPIREWDMAACDENKGLAIRANRGLAGIDGQISTFLGLCEPEAKNWAIFGDLTTLYDLAAPWIIPQLQSNAVTIIVINNFGGQIFKRMFPDPMLINSHQLSFASFASLWNMAYEQWKKIPTSLPDGKDPRVIEIIPDLEATARFWKKTEA